MLLLHVLPQMIMLTIIAVDREKAALQGVRVKPDQDTYQSASKAVLIVRSCKWFLFREHLLGYE